MNELVQQYQNYLASLGAPTWAQSPLALFSLVCGLGVLVVVVRMAFKRKPATIAAAESTRTQPARPQRPQREQPTGVFGPLTDALAKQIPESEKENREFGAMLRQAGLYSPTARASVYAFRFLFMTFPLLVAGILAVSSPPEQTWRIMIGGGIAAMAFSITPRMFVWLRRRSRLREINNGLADMLDMLSMCLGGGMPLSASLDHVARNLTSYPALGEELLIMKRQSEVGSLKMALSDWANRVDTPEVRQVATLLTRGDQLGTQLGGSLLDQADHFRTTRKALATMLANRTPVFLTFPLMFCFAPAVLILLMTPAFMELSEFFHPTNGDNPLLNNGTIDTGRIVETLGSLDQTMNIPPARLPGADE
jgi:tight adherence protein C